MNRFRTAIVGCGQISALHVAALKALDDVDIAAVCDLNEALARERASQAGIGRFFTDMEKMMREVRPDVVHVLTPPSTHATLAETAITHGAHVYVEKPLAPSFADATRIAEAAGKAGIQLCTGHSRVFDPQFLEASRRIAEGEIGRVIGIRAEQGFTYLPAARSAVIQWSYTYDWGIFDDLMPHPLSLVSQFLDDPGSPEVVAFNVGRVREAAVEEVRALIPSKTAVAEVSLSLANAPEVNRLEVVGTRGRVMVDFDSFAVVSRTESGLPSAVTRFTSNFSTAKQFAAGSLGAAVGIASGKVKRYMGLRLLVAKFYESLREGSAPPVPPEDALVVVRLMDAIREASRSAAKQRVTAPARKKPEPGPRILVTGATGFLGGRLVERFAAQGTAVRATTRLVSRARRLPNVEWVQCDVRSEDDLRAALVGVETVFHCAAIAGAPGSLEDYREANVEGTLRLITAAQEAGVNDVVYVSSMSVYGIAQDGDRPLDESVPYDERAADRGVYTQTKLAAERAVLDYAKEHDAPRVIVLRPGTIYGPGADLPVGHFRLPSSSSRPIVAGGRDLFIPLTFVDNLIDAMLRAAESDVPTGSVYNIVDSPDVDQGELARLLRRVSADRIRPFFLPYGVVWLMVLGIDLVSLARHRKIGTARFRLKRTLAQMRFDAAAARRELGWEPRVDLVEGLSRVLEASAEPPFAH